MTKEEIATALLDDMEMPYLQDWQARDIVDFVFKKYTEGLPKIKGWVARNKLNNELHFFPTKPDRYENIWVYSARDEELRSYTLPLFMFPEVTWKSEPIEVELTISRVSKIE